MTPPTALLATAPSPSISPSRQRWGLVSLSLSMLLAALGTSMANVGLPTLAQALHASFQQVQWVTLAYLLTLTALSVSAGRLGDLLGRRTLLLGGIAVFTLASALCAVAPSLGWLIAARALQGLGAASMMALTLASVGELAGASETGRAMGLLGSLSAVGSALGPLLGGSLIAGFGWPAMFWLTVPLGALAWGLAYRTLPANAPRQPLAGQFDSLGALLLALALVAYALATTLGQGQLDGRNLAWLLAALLSAGLFVRRQGRVASPLIRLPLLRDPALRNGLLGSVLVSTVMMATLVVGPFYLAHGLGLPPLQLGLVVAVGPLLAALTSAPAGRLVDRFGSRRMALLGLASLLAGSGGLSLLPLAAGVTAYLAPMGLMTAGYALFQTANNTGVMQGVTAAQRGVMAGMLNVARNLGLMSGASLMGAVFAWGTGTSDLTHAHPDAVAAGLHATFGLATLGLAGMLAMAGRR